MNTKLTLLASSLLMLVGTSAFAELYVSPIVNEASSISIINDNPSAAPVQSTGAPYPAKVFTPETGVMQSPGFKVTTLNPATVKQSPNVSGSTSTPISVTPLAVSPQVVVAKKSPGLFGKMVPLRIAANNLVPNKQWTVNIEGGLEDRKVSWSDAANYEDAFTQIERSSGLHVVLNKNESAVGIANTEQMANNLAKRSPNIYVINQTLSLRKNLEAWASKANWTIVYQEGLSADYDSLNPATLTVPFEGPGGAADILLQSTSNKKVALMGRFKSGNRTLYVEERGFDRANKLNPTE
jgi:hypothetical protein